MQIQRGLTKLIELAVVATGYDMLRQQFLNILGHAPLPTSQLGLQTSDSPKPNMKAPCLIHLKRPEHILSTCINKWCLLIKCQLSFFKIVFKMFLHIFIVWKNLKILNIFHHLIVIRR